MGRRPQTTLTLIGETRTLSEAQAAGRRLQGSSASELKGMAPDRLIIGRGRGLGAYFDPMRKPSVCLKPTLKSIHALARTLARDARFPFPSRPAMRRA